MPAPVANTTRTPEARARRRERAEKRKSEGLGKEAPSSEALLSEDESCGSWTHTTINDKAERRGHGGQSQGCPPAADPGKEFWGPDGPLETAEVTSGECRCRASNCAQDGKAAFALASESMAWSPVHTLNVT